MTIERWRDSVEYQTPDATAYLVTTIKPPTLTTWYACGVVHVVAKNDATNDTRVRVLAFGGKRAGGAAALVGSVSTLHNQGDVGTATWGTTISAGATGIEVYVSGAVATNVTWAIASDVLFLE